MSTPKEERAIVKAFGALEIKDAEKGEVEAVVATIGVVDKDAEIIAEGAIKSGAKVKLSAYGHEAVWGAMPVGKGAIHIEGNKAVFRGRYFLSTPKGAEAFAVLKEMGTEQEWSFGFHITKWEDPDDEQRGKGARRILLKLEPFEVSPVLVGAGVDTQTVSVKCSGCGSDHEGETCTPCQTKAAEAKALADAEAARIAEEARQAAERADAAMKQAATEEFERFERTRKRIGVG